MSIVKTYRYKKHEDDIGDIEKLVLHLIATDGENKAKFTVTEILSENDSESVSNMTEEELQSYAENKLNILFPDSEIEESLSNNSPAALQE